MFLKNKNTIDYNLWKWSLKKHCKHSWPYDECLYYCFPYHIFEHFNNKSKEVSVAYLFSLNIQQRTPVTHPVAPCAQYSCGVKCAVPWESKDGSDTCYDMTMTACRIWQDGTNPPVAAETRHK